MLPTKAELDTALATARSLSDEEAVGQLLMPQLVGTPEAQADAVRTYNLGGVILINGVSGGSITTAELPATTQAIQGASPDIPPLIGTDQEQGLVSRVEGPLTQFPGNMALGATGSASLARLAANDTGEELRALGVNVDFAPDADVTAGESNAAIGSRSFGSDPAQVSRLAGAAVDGYQSSGVLAVAKHFPGHGNTDVDSHIATPQLTQSLDALQDRDLVPFRTAIKAGVGAVMLGHLDVQAVDPGTPASLSGKVINDLLRKQLGFGGVVFTDAMNMEPITSRYDAGAAAVQAILAGNDVVLLPADVDAAYRGLLDAVRTGTLTRDRVNESVARIIALKRLLEQPPQPSASVVGSARHAADARHVADASVTQVAGPCLGPLVHSDVAITGDEPAVSRLTQALQANGIAVRSDAPTSVAIVGYGDGTPPAADVVVATDTPYVLARASATTKVAAYSDTSAAMQAVANVLAGNAVSPGRLPVSVPGLPATVCKRAP